MQICAAADQKRDRLRNRLQCFAAGFARRELCVLRKLRNLRQKIDIYFSIDRGFEQRCLLVVFLSPIVVSCFPTLVIREQLLFVFGEIIVGRLRDKIMFVGQSETFARGIDKFGARLAVRFEGPLHFRDAFPDQRVRDDELRFPVVVLFCAVEGVEKRLHVVAVDFLNVEPVGLESRSRVFALRHLRRSVERDRVRIVNQNQIIETEMRGERARFRRHAFLQAAIARETNAMLIENAVLTRVKSGRRHFHCDRDPNRIADTLPKRTSRALHSRCFKKFRVAGRFRMQLPETLDLRHRQIVAAQVQPGIEKHAAVTGRENKVIAADPARLLRIVL